MIPFKFPLVIYSSLLFVFFFGNLTQLSLTVYCQKVQKFKSRPDAFEDRKGELLSHVKRQQN